MRATLRRLLGVRSPSLEALREGEKIAADLRVGLASKRTLGEALRDIAEHMPRLRRMRSALFIFDGEDE